jgi:hypothetical protein
VAPDAAAVNDEELFKHIVEELEGAIVKTGNALTVTTVVAAQPEDNV